MSKIAKFGKKKHKEFWGLKFNLASNMLLAIANAVDFAQICPKLPKSTQRQFA
jgi:hypothetical protein